ncbi:MAG: response regulator transcription factor [Candidatus Korobacteraceae bacterium]
MDKILLIDDDVVVQRLLRKTFAASGFDVTAATDAASALQTFHAETPSVVILEPRIPGKTGPDLCREIRGRSASVPILVLSKAKDEVDKVLLLELGADDYVTKPFSPRELVARVRAAIRRLNRDVSTTNTFNFGDVDVNFLSMQVSRCGVPVQLTPQEFKMLRFFVSNQDRVIPDTELLHEVWNNRIYPATRTIATHILRLRQKLEKDPASPVHFRTVHGAGYKFSR